MASRRNGKSQKRAPDEQKLMNSYGSEHFLECDMQPEGADCICDRIRDKFELEEQEALEAEATGN